MQGRKGVARLALLAAAFAMAGSARASHPDTGRKPRLLLPFDAAAVRRAVAGARVRLATPRCQRLLDDFEDAGGGSLRETLAAKGLSLDGRLAGLRFFDAGEFARCREAKTYAFTFLNFDAVYVCPQRFTPTQLRTPHLAEAVIIHELLHTVGLGESPPSSATITARVADRCSG